MSPVSLEAVNSVSHIDVEIGSPLTVKKEMLAEPGNGSSLHFSLFVDDIFTYH